LTKVQHINWFVTQWKQSS